MIANEICIDVFFCEDQVRQNRQFPTRSTFSFHFSRAQLSFLRDLRSLQHILTEVLKYIYNSPQHLQKENFQFDQRCQLIIQLFNSKERLIKN